MRSYYAVRLRFCLDFFFHANTNLHTFFIWWGYDNDKDEGKEDKIKKSKRKKFLWGFKVDAFYGYTRRQYANFRQKCLSLSCEQTVPFCHWIWKTVLLIHLSSMWKSEYIRTVPLQKDIGRFYDSNICIEKEEKNKRLGLSLSSKNGDSRLTIKDT